jgi:hypothetical protein
VRPCRASFEHARAPCTMERGKLRRTCAVSKIRDKIRWLGFTTLHDSRRYAIPRCLDPSHPDTKARCISLICDKIRDKLVGWYLIFLILGCRLSDSSPAWRCSVCIPLVRRRGPGLDSARDAGPLRKATMPAPCSTPRDALSACKRELGLHPRQCYPSSYKGQCDSAEFELKQCLAFAADPRDAKLLYDASRPREVRVAANARLQKKLKDEPCSR